MSNTSNVEQKLKKIFLGIFPKMGDKNFSMEKRRSQFENWDSLTHLQLVAEIESVFKVSFEMDEIADIQKPADFIALIANKRSG